MVKLSCEKLNASLVIINGREEQVSRLKMLFFCSRQIDAALVEFLWCKITKHTSIVKLININVIMNIV